MAQQAIGASLGQNPFKVQDTFTWEDLRQGVGDSAEQARHSWETNGLPKNGEAHFFELGMDAFEDGGGIYMVLFVHLHPYDYLIFSETVRIQAAKAGDLMLPAMAHLKRLLGAPLANRVIRRYSGKMLEWLESVETLYGQEVEE